MFDPSGSAPAAKGTAEGAFYDGRMRLWGQITVALQAADLPPYAVVHTPTESRFTPGWQLAAGSGRGLWLTFQPAAVATPVTAADLAPHAAALTAAGLRCKPRERDGRSALLVLPGEEAL